MNAQQKVISSPLHDVLARKLSVPPQSCDGPLQVIAGRPQPVQAAGVHRLRIDPAKRARDDALRTYICGQYRSKNITPPVGTQQDLDQACKGAK